MMLERLIEYRKDVDIMYGNETSMELKRRNPNLSDWVIAEEVSKALMPIFKAWIRAQASGAFLLSDTIDTCIKVSIKLSAIKCTDGMTGGGAFECELRMYCDSIKSTGNEYLRTHLYFLRIFDSELRHYMAALILDPCYATLDLVRTYADLYNTLDVKAVVWGYTKLLLELMCAVYVHRRGIDEKDLQSSGTGEAARFDLFGDS